MTASKPQLTIILHCTAERWWGHWRELGIDVPLPFKPEATFYRVFDSVRTWYPEADIVFDKIEIEGNEADYILTA
jgi:hypothetical protein